MLLLLQSVTGLIHRTEFNDCVATVVGQLNEATNRCVVQVGTSDKKLWLKPENLRPLSEPFTADPQSLSAQRSAESVPGTLAQKMDDALALYYAQSDRSDYYGEGGKDAGGLFLQFCDENGIDVDDDEYIREELAMDYHDCIFTHFADDFPLDADSAFKDEPVDSQVLRVLRNCYLGRNVDQFGSDPMAQRSPSPLFPSSYALRNRCFCLLHTH